MSEQDTQVFEATNSDEELELDLELEDESEDIETPALDVRNSPEFRQVLARAKKAEAELKATKVSTEKATPKADITNTLTEEAVEIKILKSQGKSDDEITQLKKIARVNETSIFDALSDPYFVAWKEAKEQEAKANKAKLPTSKGSSSVRQTKDFGTRDLTDEEHKELWKQRQA